MSTRRLSQRCAAVLTLLAAFVGTAVGQDESGACSASPNRWDASSNTMPRLDDALAPLDGACQRGRDSVDVRDTANEVEPDGAALALWEQLALLTADERANARIELELRSAATVAQHETAAEIAALWNHGSHDAALALLRSFEQSGAPLGLGIAWRVPLNHGGQRFADLRIGGTRTDAQTMSLDFDAQTGNVFAVLRWGSTTGVSAWTVNLSDDGGITWTETYAFGSASGLIDLDCAVVDDFLYIAYVAGNATGEARLRRASVSTGGIDVGFSFQAVFLAGAETIEEVALATNADYSDNRIYYLAIQSDDTLRYAWDAADDGTTFTEQSPATASPEFGLDATWHYNAASCDDFLYVSYAGNDGNIHVFGRSAAAWTDWVVEPATGSSRRTAISAYGDVVICAFEYPYTYGTGVRYRISYDCGDTWSAGSLAVPDGATIFGYFEPDVDARDGDGIAIIYQGEAGEFDPLYYRKRAGFAPGAWSDPALLNDFDIYTGSETAISYLPALEGELFSHGAMYLSLDPDFRTPYFDRPRTGSGPCDDVTPPIVEISTPAALSCGCDLLNITGSVDDPDGTYAGDRLEYRRHDVTTWTVADSATGARTGALYTWDASALPEGSYFIRVVGENECALSASDATLVYRSTSFATAELRSPLDGGVYGGIVTLDGTANDESCFEEYTADYREAGSGTWNPVDPPHSPYLSAVINDPLATWDTTSGPSAVPDGVYEVRLQGTTVCGDTATIAHKISIDNTVPDADITNIANGATLDGLVTITGTAADEYFASWILEYQGGDTTSWATIASGNTPVFNATFETWDTTSLLPGPYVLRLTVTDEAVLGPETVGHQTEIYRTVNVSFFRADMNCDGIIDLFDIEPFVNCLTGHGCDCP